MLAGELYNASDPLLTQERQRARALTHQLNVSHYGNQSVYNQIISFLLPNAAADIWIEPPFFCDYGYNIKVGDDFYANHGCIILDVNEVIIGDDVLFGPNVQVYTAAHPCKVIKEIKDI